MSNPIKVTIGEATLQSSTSAVVIPVTFQGLSPQDAAKAVAILDDLATVIQGGHVNLLGLVKLASDIGVLR